MVKLYAQKGKIGSVSAVEATYYCGTYLVSLTKGSAEYVVATGFPKDPYQFYTEEYFSDAMRFYKHAVIRNPFKTGSLKIKKILKSLVDQHFYIEGSGKTEKDAVHAVLDQVSLWSFIIPGSEAENLLHMMPDYFAALVDKENLLSELERTILDIVNAKELIGQKLSPREVHGETSYKKYYVTMEYLCHALEPHGHRAEDIYEAVKNLYQKHCIYFCDSTPTELYRPSDPICALVDHSIGENIGLPISPFELAAFRGKQ